MQLNLKKSTFARESFLFVCKKFENPIKFHGLKLKGVPMKFDLKNRQGKCATIRKYSKDEKKASGNWRNGRFNFL